MDRINNLLHNCNQLPYLHFIIPSLHPSTPTLDVCIASVCILHSITAVLYTITTVGIRVRLCPSTRRLLGTDIETTKTDDPCHSRKCPIKILKPFPSQHWIPIQLLDPHRSTRSPSQHWIPIQLLDPHHFTRSKSFY